MEEKPRWRQRLLTLLCLPVVVLIMVPLAVVFAAAFYGLGILGAFRHLGASLLSRKTAPAENLQKPHFLEARVQIRDGRRE